jgi:hypothetical protein
MGCFNRLTSVTDWYGVINDMRLCWTENSVQFIVISRKEQAAKSARPLFRLYRVSYV